MRKRIFFLIILVFFQLTFSDWIKERIGPFNDWVSGIVIAKGRNDDTNRIYVATWRRLYELTYRNGNWNIFDMGLTNGWGVCAGDGRNDGMTRIYATFVLVSPQRSGVWEYTWTGNGWQKDTAIRIPPLSPSSPAAHGVAIGKARNDGINRIYCDDGNNRRIYEGYWTGTQWISGVAADSYGVDIIIAPARRDGINRIYCVGLGAYIYEFSWDGNRWVRELVDSTGRGYYGIACGYGRNDSVLRLYSAWGSSPYGVYEFTWDGTRWIKERIKGINALPATVFIGDARNDGLNRIYVGCYGGKAMEYFYNGNQWDSCWVDSAGSGSYVSIFIGDGRNDGINRLYLGSSDNYLYEYSYISSDIKERDSDLIISEKIDNKCYNSLGQLTPSSQLKKGIYFLYKKGRLKKYVKIR